MADFTGMTIRVTMKDGLVVHGKVGEVVAGQTLTLQQVKFQHNGQRLDRYILQSANIADLQVVDTNAASTPTSAIRTSAPPLPTPNPPISQPSVPTATPSKPAFVDPAILSYGRSPVQSRNVSTAQVPATPVKSMLAKAAESLPTNSSPFIGEAGKSSDSRKAPRMNDRTHRVEQPLNDQTQNIQADGTQEGGQHETQPKKKARRSQKKKPVSSTPDPPPVMNVEVSRNGNDMSASVKRGKGWRSTPLLQPFPTASSPQTKANSKKTRKQIESQEAQQNGWATEDATDIQDMGDFDFEANHKLFDKKQVFDELRQGDTTADEDRLVSHNKVHRPGTYGGKNLHPTENVLSPQLGAKPSNEVDSSSDADTEKKVANGRSSSRHSTTRTSFKTKPSRQNSAQVEAKPHPLTASMSSERGDATGSVTSRSGKVGRNMPWVTTSPMPDRTRSPVSAISAAKANAASQVAEPHFAIRPTMTACPVLLPSALETLETETIARFGLTPEAITESAARCVAEIAMSMFDYASGSRRGSRANTIRGSMNSSFAAEREAQPVVVILAGNHATGARAVAAVRHLVCRRVKIIVAEAQYESADVQDVQLKTQLAMLKRMVKGGASIKRGPWQRASRYIKGLSGPPTVIIDALLAGSTYDSMVDSANAQYATQMQQELREMIDWANRSRACVLSLACPSGISGSDGSSTIIEGEPLAIRPDKILCLGAPMHGVLDATKAGERWDISVADIGINITLRSDEAVAFGAQWVADLKYFEDGVMTSAAQ